jgi:predicted 3-demethylubiquinone-9 3-methyltransferase (glyoxalase superfamily)
MHMTKPKKVSTFLWFDNNAEEAVNFYVSLIENSKILGVVHYGEAGPGPKGQVMIMSFELAGQRFTALNGGPMFKFTEAVSISVECETQSEIDRLWNALCEGGKPVQCGWLKDRHGLSWQIVPAMMEKLMGGGDPTASDRAMSAMMGMVKLDIAGLQKAYDGR